ncbi:peptidyl-prolyl cis-trans isomerase C [Octadecabacter temperatus]|uniref:Parvulin-like PPIase n=1 Tax=Octadecabacter temperatus TaxID=1458307 RepID=A0A0K0Y9P8_9RHOB|nr:peptidylprolyl isomerase [Octadecabacter temperatus]AKS47674.1 putative parvulin-type peptidyl-prolyl cis-trans isomerase precursor [Octadecabacter temperatus]SIO39976.1 peptidyl-prolyl cis-trans isomerase C [Octadecabacter temperatus]
MLFRTKLLASAALFSFTTTFAYADSHAGMSAETVVASVNGSEITLGQLVMLRSQLPEQYQQLPDDVVFNGLVEQLVNQQLLADSLEVEPKRVGIALANETRSLRAGEVVNSITSAPVSDEEIQTAYDARFEGVEPDSEFNASHILVETEEEANEVKTLIDDGADFAETAVERSTGPSGPSGGELGWFGVGMMVPEFEAAVMTLEVGEVSVPVQTQFGWHVVQLNETRETELPTVEDLRSELASEIQQETLNTLITGLTEAAEVTLPEEGQFDFSLIQNLELLED